MNPLGEKAERFGVKGEQEMRLRVIGGHKEMPRHVFGQDLMSRWQNFNVKSVALPWECLPWFSLILELSF